MDDLDLLIDDDEDLEYQPHITNDPAVFGIDDIARGRSALVPTTVYNRAGDSASGVAGLLQLPWEFLPVAPSRVGRVVVEPDDDRDLYELTTVWDGAAPSPEFRVTLENGTVEVRRESSKGILLAGYDSRPPARSKVGRLEERFYHKAGLIFEEGPTVGRVHLLRDENPGWDDSTRRYEGL